MFSYELFVSEAIVIKQRYGEIDPWLIHHVP